MDRISKLFGYGSKGSDPSQAESLQTSSFEDQQSQEPPQHSIFQPAQSRALIHHQLLQRSHFLGYQGVKSPLHERFLSFPIDIQSASPLLNGTLPAEIRIKIYDYAMEEYIVTQYATNTPYSRPGSTGRLAVTTSLLRTCRLIYLETYHLPLLKKSHTFYHASSRGPNPTIFPNIHSFDHETHYFSKLQAWQQPLVRKVHLFTQMFWLEHHHCFIELCQNPYMQSVQTLKISIRRGDWWYNESNQALQINPFRSKSDYRFMVNDMKTAKTGQSTHASREQNVWGNAFNLLGSLKDLEIELETSDDKKGELDYIVEWAKTWVFPAASWSKELRMEEEVERWSWESPLSYWSHICPYCHGYEKCSVAAIREERPRCVNRTNKRSEGKGPVCHVASVKWKVVDFSEEERRQKRQLEEEGKT